MRKGGVEEGGGGVHVNTKIQKQQVNMLFMFLTTNAM